MTFLAAAVRVLLGALAAGAVGYALARFFTSGLRPSEKAAWSFATGLLAQSILFLAVVSIFPGRALVWLLVLDALIVAASFGWRRPTTLLPRPARKDGHARDAILPRPAQRGEGWGEGPVLILALLAIAAAACLLFLVSALSEPMWSTDYLAIWGLKGKTIAVTDHVPSRLFSDPALFWAHREYPLTVPLSLAMLAAFAGGWHEQALALLYPLCQVATLAALYGFLSRRASPLAGAVAATLAALCFPLYRAVNAGTAEVPFALSVVLASAAFLDALSDRSRETLARLAIASLFCVSIKQEGWLFVGLLAAALAVRRAWVPALTLAAPAALHWMLLYLLRGPQMRRDFDFTLFQPGKWSELAPRFFQVLGRFGTETLAAWLPLLAIVLYLAVTRRGFADPLLLVLALQILCYAVAFSVSSFDPMYAVDGAFRRIATTLFPALTLVLAARLEETRRTAA